MRRASLVVAGLLCTVTAACAQAPAAGAVPRSAQRAAERERAASDSAARARVLQHVWEIMAPHLLAASLDTTLQAWTLAFPADDFPWGPAEAHLRQALRARSPLPTDSVTRRLTVSALRVERDTAWATVTVDREQRCPSGPGASGWGNAHYIFTPRVGPGGPWGSARTSSVLHGDRVACAPPR